MEDILFKMAKEMKSHAYSINNKLNHDENADKEKLSDELSSTLFIMNRLLEASNLNKGKDFNKL